jgi:hypothetical protein
MPKSYRIRTQVGVDKYINVKLDQDFDFLEILSLKINQSDLYTKVCSDYGVVVGRILVNGGFGIPNAKVSVFIPLSNEDELNPTISELYPYKTLSDNNDAGYRYNLLPHDPSYSVHAATGTFPNRDEVLLDQTYIEVYDKYYKYTVKTNDSGDYMIFGVPTGTQTIFMDVDLSDIGCFSLTPQDLINAGQATETQVNGATFKRSSNLSELPQIKTLNKNIDISPLWGQEDICQIGITRVDFDLTSEANVTIRPNAIFMGSIISNTNDDALKTSCKPKNDTGNLCDLISGPGQILAIRQTIFPDKNNLPVLEEHKFEQDGKIIDGDGAFLANVPMNLDYIVTNEFGEQVISNDPTKGIPTKGRYRFKFKWNNEGGLQNEFQRANFLVPNIKEHGWSSSGSEPFAPNSTTPKVFDTIAGNTISGAESIAQDGGLLFNSQINTENFTVFINGSPYYGDTTVIPVSAGDILTIQSTPIDNTQPQQFNFTFFPQSYFDLLRSYTFSLDWDDYVDPISAINCEDTFYEMNYNKVYTTAMFLDRYKNGISRARHLGIKEIDDRTCKSTNNTFPVNDIIRNFDFIFFIFNILINVLTFPLLVLLFVAHFIAWAWPVLKYLLIVLGIVFAIWAIWSAIDTINNLLESTATAVPGGPVINIGLILRIAFQIIKAIFYVALAAAFIAFTVKYLLKIKNFPRIGLPMISYPECTSCDCDCGPATLDDDIDAASVQASIDAESESSSSKASIGAANTFLAPVISSGSYKIDHPNMENPEDEDIDDRSAGPYWCGSGFFQTIITGAVKQDYSADVAARALLDYKRLFSGYDILFDPTKTAADVGKTTYFANEFSLYHAPQPFMWAAEENSGVDPRYWAYPLSETYPQKLNEFNTRDKFFITLPNGPDAPNIIRTTVNEFTGNTFYEDQVVVLLASSGTKNQMGTGEIITFQNPTQSSGLVNITGGTVNQYGNNAVTGTTITGTTVVQVSGADTNNINNPSNTTTINLTIYQENDGGFLKYPTDVEYFQMITGLTINEFFALDDTTNPNLYPSKYLRHAIRVAMPTCGAAFNNTALTPKVALYQMENYQDYEVIILVRGVDPNTTKQTIKYDLSRIFGYTSWGVSVGSTPLSVEGSYYMNIPIQANPDGSAPYKPITHNTPNNNVPNLYHNSFTFTPDSTIYTAFTSNYPYYYLSTDDTSLADYTPSSGGWPTLGALTVNRTNLPSNSDYTLPRQQTDYIGGGSFIGSKNNTPIVSEFLYPNTWTTNTPDGGNEGEIQLGYPPAMLNAVYSPAYYRYGLGGVDFNNSQKIVMRSDRLPTSTKTEDGAGSRTGFALFQNRNFTFYTADGAEQQQSTGIASSLPSGEQFDLPSGISSIASTLDCDNIVSLKCYQGSGTNVTVIPPDQCSVPANRVKKGCYCLLNKEYISQYDEDVALFLEWKTRFTITFAACRGVFAQVFQNNWINGTLYMFAFNKTATYTLTNPNEPTYNYCDDVIIFNELTNGFYYRSSPWKESTQEFIGKNSPSVNPLWPTSLITGYPGLGYNKKQIQFPTTIADLGPRDKFISEICNNSNFNGYMADQVKSTSYQDNSDVIQIGFLSRLLNDTFRQAILPIANPNGNTEGVGIVQFFNSTRGADRIDGDFAQSLSINSEWKVSPFLVENYPNANSIFFGDDSLIPPRPVFGVFYEVPEENYNYRRKLSPGFETYSLNPLIQDYYGFPKTQDVPHYMWTVTPSANIFGSENNNWYTDVTVTGGFYKKGYQDLDSNVDPYYSTSTTKLGVLTNFDVNGDPIPTPQAATYNPIIVGAPYFFYFGLSNGKTAMDLFAKLYINTNE